jgi:hypothetical protein
VETALPFRAHTRRHPARAVESRELVREEIVEAERFECGQGQRIFGKVQ